MNPYRRQSLVETTKHAIDQAIVEARLYDIAAACDIKQSSLSSFRSGKRGLRICELERLAKTVGVRMILKNSGFPVPFSINTIRSKAKDASSLRWLQKHTQIDAGNLSRFVRDCGNLSIQTLEDLCRFFGFYFYCPNTVVLQVCGINDFQASRLKFRCCFQGSSAEDSPQQLDEFRICEFENISPDTSSVAIYCEKQEIYHCWLQDERVVHAKIDWRLI